MMSLLGRVTTSKPAETVPAAAAGVALSPSSGSSRFGPIAVATCIARSQLVRIFASDPITFSLVRPKPLETLDWADWPSTGSTGLRSRTYRTRSLASDWYTFGKFRYTATAAASATTIPNRILPLCLKTANRISFRFKPECGSSGSISTVDGRAYVLLVKVWIQDFAG